MRNQIILGDALTVLKTLPDCSVQMCCTSPPYYNLRDYQIEGQIGLEDTPQAYIARLVEVFREVRRVLRDDGTLWLNIGDSYVANKTGSIGSTHSERMSMGTLMAGANRPDKKPIDGLKPKDLMMIPARVALALQEDGYYLRSDVIWSKPNCMPESVTDRPTSAHEHVFLLAKNERYFYDADAIREPGQEWSGQSGTFARINGKATFLTIPGQEHVSHRINRDDRVPSGRNKRNVWTIASQPYSEAHFATMPPKLVEPCILAGTSPRACEHCGAPWERVTEHTPMIIRNGPKSGAYGSRTTDGLSGTMLVPAETRTTGWQPTCTCTNEGSGKCIVLDPFMGAGTVALVAIQYKRDYLGIELNPDYVNLINKRIDTVQQGLWTEVAI